jgi:hypothetical protein
MAYGERDRLIDPASLPAGSLVGSLVGWLWPLTYLLLCLVLLLFPDGRLPSPGWGPAARLILVAWGASILVNPLAPADGNRLRVPALGRPAGQLLLLVVNAAALAGLVLAAAAPFLRFRRAGYQQRQQLKWVAFTVAVSVRSVLVGLGLGQLFPGVPVIGLLGLLSAVGWSLGFRWRWRSCGIGCPTSTGSSTAPWSMGCSPSCWRGSTPAWCWLLGSCSAASASRRRAGRWPAPPWPWPPCSSRPGAAPGGRGSALHRRTYNAARTVEAFGSRLREQVDLDTLSTELLAVVDDRCSRPGPRHGYGHRLRCHRGEGKQASQADPALTPCLPSTDQRPRHGRYGCRAAGLVVRSVP